MLHKAGLHLNVIQETLGIMALNGYPVIFVASQPSPTFGIIPLFVPACVFFLNGDRRQLCMVKEALVPEGGATVNEVKQIFEKSRVFN